MDIARSSQQAARALQPYAPRLAIEWLAEHPDEMHRAVDGTLAFLDLSGFTKLTERLARVGRSGPEELSDILDSTFGALLGSAQGDGADLVKWGGDAVLLLFRGEDHAKHAVRAAYRMRETLREVGQTTATAGRVTLRMSVGIHSGRFHFFLVGSPDLHRELIVSGPGASVTAQMESIAQAGQIVVSDATAALLDPPTLGIPVPGGRVLRSSLRSAPLVADVPEPRPHDIDVAPLIPPPVREHLLSAAGSSEHRTVAVSFIQFSGTDELIGASPHVAVTDEAVAAMDEVVRNVQTACASLGVTFLESDINKDGGKILLVSGAPRSSGEDDDRLISAVRLIITRQGRLPLRAGANHGRVFSGDFGPSFRRTYSIKGDAINVAARVMAHAEPATLLGTDEVMSRAGGRFESRAVPPFLVKGKAKPIHASEVGAVREDGDDDRHSDDAFVGRDEELAAATAALQAAKAGTGSLVEVVGEPGMGKSRLVEEIVRVADELVVVTGPSGSYEHSTPYYPFRTLLRGLLDLRRDDPERVVGDRLRNRVELNAEHLMPWLPLLGIVLGVDLPPTQATQEADPRFLQTKLEEVLVEFLGLVLPTPTLFVFENVHLTDDASVGLLRRLEDGLTERPWFVLVTRRDLETGYVPGEHRSRRLDLRPIAGTEAVELLVSASGGTPLSQHAMDAIVEKAGGNPLFLKALVHAASHAVDGELPDSIEAVLTKEIDRLPPDSRTLLRGAAVLGVRFSEPMLREMLTATDSPAADVDLATLGDLVEPTSDGRWRFQHALIREAAYAGLPYRLRRRMHRYAGRALEASTADPEDVSERLSMHFSQAGDQARTWTYSRMAGARARNQYAYTAAMEFFGLAFDSGRADGVPDSQLAEVLEARGDVCDVAGASREAVTAYRRARSYRRDDPLGRATLLLKEAGLHQRLGAFVTSLRLLTQGRGILSESVEPEAAAVRARLATRYGFGKYLQGQHKASLKWSVVGVEEAKQSGDHDALAYAYNTRHVACLHAGVDDDEDSGRRALDLYRELGDLRMQGHCLNNLAIAALGEGAWSRSGDLLDQAADLFRRVGDTTNEANALYNRADLLIRQRRFADAEPLLLPALRAARAAHDRELVALVMREHGRALTGLNRTDEAASLLEGARQELTDLGLSQELVLLDQAEAELLLMTGDAAASVRLAGEALDRADAARAEAAFASLHRVRGYAHAVAGELTTARADFEAGMASPDSGDGRCEYALSLWGVAALTRRDDPAEADRLFEQSRKILDGLGVVVPETSDWG